MDTDKKKILVVDDSALMRRVICDIINSDRRFMVVARASDGIEALELLEKNTYDGIVLDINMPRMNGLELLAELKKRAIYAKVLVASTDTSEGAQVTIDALEAGALDFIQKPGSSAEFRGEKYTTRFLELLNTVCSSRVPHHNRTVSFSSRFPKAFQGTSEVSLPDAAAENRHKRKIVAIASSTGGPKALQSLIPLLPRNLDAPVLLVQHMPKGFTASLAERLNGLSKILVKEARDGEPLLKGVVYVAMGGKHLNVAGNTMTGCTICYSDQPSREGVKPSANYMYESLITAGYTDVVCVVLTGMGVDGTEGICNLKKVKKDTLVIAQDQESCVVYGMPKGVVNAGVSDLVLPLEEIADKITQLVGVSGLVNR